MQSSPIIAATRNKDGRYTTGPGEKSRPQRTANIRTLFVIKIKETAGETKVERLAD